MAVVGFAEVQVGPTFTGFQSKVSKAASQLETSLAKAGKEGGDQAGSAASKGLNDKLGDGAEAGKKFAGGFSGALKGVLAGGAILGLANKIGGTLSQAFSDAITQSDATDKFKQTLQFAGIAGKEVSRLTKVSQEYADKTVYDLSDIQNSTAQLAANGFKNADQLTQAMGNLNAVAGGNSDTFKSVGMAVTQVAGAGKLTTENWNQLADAIPGASGILQKSMKDAGAYTGNFRDAMAKGEITAEEFAAAIQKTGGTKVAQEAATSTKTIEGAWGGLQATITGTLAGLITAAKPFITDVLTGMSTGIETTVTVVKSAVAWFQKYQNIILPLAAVFGVLTAAVAAYAIQQQIVAAGGIIQAFKSLSVVTKTTAAAQWLLNAAMTANPIGLVVVAIAALAAGFIVAYKKSETFRNIVNGVFNGIKTVVGAVVTWFKETLVPLFTKTIPGAIGGAINWVKKNWPVILAVITGPIGLAVLAVVKNWDKITGAFKKAKDWVVGGFKKGWSAATGAISGAVGKGKDAVVGAWDKTTDAFQDAKDWVSGKWKKSWGGVKNWIGDAVGKGKDAVGKSFDKTSGIRQKFNSVKTWAKDTWGKSWKNAKGWIADPVGKAKDSVGKAFDATSGVRSKFNSVKGWAKDKWSKQWAKAKDWIKDPVGKAKNSISTFLGSEGVRKTFNAVDTWGREKFGPRWGKMKEKLSGPIGKARDYFKRVFGSGGGGVRKVFTDFVAAAGRIFDKLKNAVMSPIKSLISTINQGLIKNGINWILTKLGVPKNKQVPWIPTPKFAQGGRVKPRNAWQRGGTDRINALLDRDELVVKRDSVKKADRALPGGLDYLNATGKWPVGPMAQRLPGLDQQARRGPGVPARLPGIPGNLGDIIRQGPRPGDKGGFGANPIGYAMSQVGKMGWYQKCLAFVNAAWNYEVPRFRMPWARHSMNAGPRSMQGVPPAGAATYWDTGTYGHIALAAGDGTVFSNDIRAAGRIDRVPQGEINKWGPYMGWWHPGGAKAGTKGGGLLGAIGGAIAGAMDFLKGVSPVKWLTDKASGLKVTGGGILGSALSYVPKYLVGKAGSFITDKIEALAGILGGGEWTGGSVGGWDKSQLDVAAKIISQAKAAGVGQRGALVGLITAMQESTLRELSGGDRDSVGPFQQRAPWGSFAARKNTSTSAAMFYNGGAGGQPGLKDKHGWASMSPGAAAQAVQVSAFPSAYSKWIDDAQKILGSYKFDSGGMLPTGHSLVYNGTGKPEPVLTGEQWQALQGGGTTVINVHVEGTLNDDRTIGKLLNEIERFQRRRGSVSVNLRSR